MCWTWQIRQPEKKEGDSLLWALGVLLFAKIFLRCFNCPTPRIEDLDPHTLKRYNTTNIQCFTFPILKGIVSYV